MSAKIQYFTYIQAQAPNKIHFSNTNNLVFLHFSNINNRIFLHFSNLLLINIRHISNIKTYICKQFANNLIWLFSWKSNTFVH